ncbi:Viral T-cell receptor beta chain-like T17T-22 [Larimichthys crocea]|uniref:Uncharacterized protein n=1 Tax=Larimichthys crocea TaxID=215358 RepID=A0ACD3RQ38_LARCR|nr:Viral T-cell receptor beta chain-like T17T-22 [Larimichthys crocea]
MSLPLRSDKPTQTKDQLPFSFPPFLHLFLAVTEIAAVRLERVQPPVSPTCTAALTDRQRWRLRYGEAGLSSGLFDLKLKRCANYEAYFGQGTKLTVLDPDQKLNPPQVKVLEPSVKECRNKKKTLVCVASKFYPDHVSVYWKIDGDNHTDGVVTDNNALKKDDGSYTITSRLRVAAEDWYTPDKLFTCIVSFYDGKETKDYPDTIYGVEAPAAGRELTRERYLRLTNAAKLSYGVFIAKSCIYGAFVAFLVWKLQKKVKAVVGDGDTPGLETLQRSRERQQRTGCGHRAACRSSSVLRNDKDANFHFTTTSGSHLHLCSKPPTLHISEQTAGKTSISVSTEATL